MRENDNAAAFEHAQVAGLQGFVGQAMHDGKRVCDQALGGRMLLNELEELECEGVSLFRNLRDISAAFETEQHAEDLGDGALELSCHLTLGQAIGLVCQQFDDVQTFFKGGRCVVQG